MEAIIFDMDGVISDTEKLHGIAESEVLNTYGIAITPEQVTDRFAGVPEMKVWEILFEEYGKSMPPQTQLQNEKFTILSALASGNVIEIPGSLDLIRMTMNHTIPRGIASSSRPEFINIVTRALKIHDWFDAVTSGTEVTNGKPSPDIFLLAAKKLNATPSHCIVIEDAASGCRAAKAAGMICIGYLPAGSKQDLSPADLIVPDLRDITWETLMKLA